MEAKETPLELALQIWKDGSFITTTLEEKRKSLYRFQDNYYILYYTADNRLELVQKAGKAKIRKIFRDHVSLRKKGGHTLATSTAVLAERPV